MTPPIGKSNNYYNSVGDMKNAGIVGKRKDATSGIWRNVNGEMRQVIKTKDGYFAALPGGGWTKVNIASDGLFKKKTFSVTPNQDQVTISNTPETQVPEKPKTASATSSPQIREDALKQLSTNFDNAIAEYKENHKNEDNAPLWLNNLSAEDIKKLENGTPVYVTKSDGNGGNLSRTGVIFNGMLIQDKVETSKLGEENNFRSLSAIDPNAYRRANENFRIGAVQIFNNGETNIALNPRTSSSPQPYLADAKGLDIPNNNTETPKFEGVTENLNRQINLDMSQMKPLEFEANNKPEVAENTTTKKSTLKGFTLSNGSIINPKTTKLSISNKQYYATTTTGKQVQISREDYKQILDRQGQDVDYMASNIQTGFEDLS